nr:hypothetical protein [Shewanella decolorationis]
MPDEPFGQHLAGFSAALSSVYVEQLHCTDFALHKSPPNCCKNNPETSTRPHNISNIFDSFSINHP